MNQSRVVSKQHLVLIVTSKNVDCVTLLLVNLWREFDPKDER